MMDAKVDYLSWSIMVDCSFATGEGEALALVESALRQRHTYFFEQFVTALEWQEGPGRGHYGASFFQPLTFAMIRYGGKANHILIELPGTACQWLRDNARIDPVLAECSARATRVDLAVDIPGGCSPLDFVRAGYNQRFKSYAEIVSESGVTEYVGSMKSERYARVYMYNPPHPRAGVLRVEHVLRGDYAKAAIAALDSGATLMLAEMCGNTWGWLSPQWQPEHTTDGKLKASRVDRHEPGRVRWLYQVVIPALRRASDEGLINLPEFWAKLTDF